MCKSSVVDRLSIAFPVVTLIYGDQFIIGFNLKYL